MCRQRRLLEGTIFPFANRRALSKPTCFPSSPLIADVLRIVHFRPSTKKTLFDLLGPVIDPIGYQIELETYIANAMRGPANLYISLVGFATSALMFFHFFVDPRQALTVSLLASSVCLPRCIAAPHPPLVVSFLFFFHFYRVVRGSSICRSRSCSLERES